MYTSLRQEGYKKKCFYESLKAPPVHALHGGRISSMCDVLEGIRYKNIFLPLPREWICGRTQVRIANRFVGRYEVPKTKFCERGANPRQARRGVNSYNMFPSPTGEDRTLYEYTSTEEFLERVNLINRHCEEVTGVTDEAILPMLHKYNNFTQKKTVNKKLDRHALIGLAMTGHRFLPLSGEVRRGVNPVPSPSGRGLGRGGSYGKH